LTEEEKRDNVIRLAFAGRTELYDEFCNAVRDVIPPETTVVLRGSATSRHREWRRVQEIKISSKRGRTPFLIGLAVLAPFGINLRGRMAQGDEDTARPLATEHEPGAISLEDEHAHDERNRVLLGVDFRRLPTFRHTAVFCKMAATTFLGRPFR